MIAKENLSLTDKVAMTIEFLIHQEYLDEQLRITKSKNKVYVQDKEHGNIFIFSSEESKQLLMYDNGKTNKKIMYRNLREVITKDIINKINKLVS